MKLFRQSLRSSRTTLIVPALAVFISAEVSSAQAQSRFSMVPAERTEFAEKMARKAQTRRKEAQTWAKTNGIPLRIDTGRQLHELVAIRNGKPLYIKTLNVNAAISTATDQVRQTAPYSLDGTGLAVGIWDGGSVMTNHQEFGNRIENKNNVASHYHATHVGGTIAASGVDYAAIGMAPAILVDSYDWHSDYSEMATAAASAPGESATRIYLSNHSYGYGVGWDDGTFYGFEEFGKYNSYSRDLDQLIHDSLYYLPFWSAGNDRNDTGDGSEPGDGEYKNGYDTISFSSVAKNVITVGAVNDAVSGGIRSLANATMASFSSWGPTDDGRIKPDIVANGNSLKSCYNRNTSDYAWMSGTSMSSPNACGSAALLVEYYKEHFDGEAMTASTLKGLIIHTADDLGNPGPDYEFGWGLMNTKAAADLLKDAVENNTQRIAEGTLDSGNMNDTFTVSASKGDSLKVTLCWTDPPGPIQTASDSRTPVLMNDLDLKIIGPGGTSYPYKLSYSNPSAIATTNSENNVDNVEQVAITVPAAGNYTILVDCDEALYDSYPSPNVGGDQTYSLLITQVFFDTDADGLPDKWEDQYFSTPTGAVASVDSDGDGADNLTEYFSGHNPSDPNSFFSSTITPVTTNGHPYVITWDSVTNRIYNISRSDSLLTGTFTNISGDLPHPINTYTDSLERVGPQIFYRIDVELEP
jgi:hypothetical protein